MYAKISKDFFSDHELGGGGTTLTREFSRQIFTHY